MALSSGEDSLAVRFGVRQESTMDSLQTSLAIQVLRLHHSWNTKSIEDTIDMLYYGNCKDTQTESNWSNSFENSQPSQNLQESSNGFMTMWELVEESTFWSVNMSYRYLVGDLSNMSMKSLENLQRSLSAFLQSMRINMDSRDILSLATAINCTLPLYP